MTKWLQIQIILQAFQLESRNSLPFPIVFLRIWVCSFSSSSSSWDLQLLPLERHITQICKISGFTAYTAYNTCPSAYTTQMSEYPFNYGPKNTRIKSRRAHTGYHGQMMMHCVLHLPVLCAGRAERSCSQCLNVGSGTANVIPSLNELLIAASFPGT